MRRRGAVFAGPKRQPWWELHPLSPELQALLKDWSAPYFNPYCLDAVCDEAHRAFSALGSPGNLTFKGVQFAKLLAELRTFQHLTEPHSPALLAWQSTTHLGAYTAFAATVTDWRINGVRLLRAAMLYFWWSKSIPLFGGLKADVILDELIGKSTASNAESRFEISEVLALSPSHTTFLEWANLLEEIVAHQPNGGVSFSFFGELAKAIRGMPKAVQLRQIKLDLSPNATHRSIDVAQSDPQPQGWEALQPQLRDTTKTLLRAFGVIRPARLDLEPFTANARHALSQAPQSEHDSANWVALDDALQQLATVRRDLPLLSDDYRNWWNNHAKAPQSELDDPAEEDWLSPDYDAPEQVEPFRRDLPLLSDHYRTWWNDKQPLAYASFVAEAPYRYLQHAGKIRSLVLRSLLLPAPREPQAAARWLQATTRLQRMAHDLCFGNEATQEGMARILELTPIAATTKSSTKKLLKLVEDDGDVTEFVTDLVLVLEAIRAAGEIKADSPPSRTASPDSTKSIPGEISTPPAVRDFLDRIDIRRWDSTSRERLKDTLTHLLKQTGGQTQAAAIHKQLEDVVAALGNEPLLHGEESANAGSTSQLAPAIREALTLYPNTLIEHELRKLQLVLFQHLGVQSTYVRGINIWSHELDVPLANLIVDTHRIDDLEIMSEARAFLVRLPLTPTKEEKPGSLWSWGEKRAYSGDSIRILVAVLKVIQKALYPEQRAPSSPDAEEASGPPTTPSGEPLSSGLSPKGPSTLRPHSSSRPRKKPARRGIPSSSSISSERRTKTTGLRGPVRSPTPEEREHIRRDGDTVEENTTSLEAVLLEGRHRSMVPAQLRAFASRQLSAMRQGVWARHQWDALTTEESATIVHWLLEVEKQQDRNPDYVAREAAAMCVLCATTGFSLRRAYAIRNRASSDPYDDVWVPSTATLTIPLPGEDQRFEPTPEQAKLLSPVEVIVRLRLPDEVSEILGGLKADDDEYVFACGWESLKEVVTGLIKEGRRRISRLSMPRLERSFHLEVLNQVGDIATAQLICGDALGVATTPTAYYSASSKTLQQGYDRAARNLRLTPSLVELQNESRVGSKLLVDPDKLNDFVSHVQRGVIQLPRSTRTVGRAALSLHAELVPSLAILFIAATAHRPTFRLGLLTARWLCLTTGLAVIEDKLSDELRESRLVPMCALLRSSLAAYGKHLEAMKDNAALLTTHQQAAERALSGNGPLFFVIEQGGARSLTMADLEPRFPAEWNLPKNFLRHHVATALRDRGCPGVYVQALMGHIEAGIQPFGSESFMSPLEFLEVSGKHLDGMLRADGWRAMLGGSDDFEVFERHSRSLVHDIVGLQSRHARSCEDEFRKQRRHVERIGSEEKEAIDASVAKIVSGTMPDSEHTSDNPLEVSAEQVTAMCQRIFAEAEDLAHAELSIGSLRAHLLAKRSLGHWKVTRIPSFHVPRPTPSVFSSEFVPLYSAVARLRRMLQAELIVPAKLSPEVRTRQCVLALILWQGICTVERLSQVLKGLACVRRTRTIDAIVVPVEMEESATGRKVTSSEILRGAVALIALAAKPHQACSFDKEWIGDMIHAWIPTDIINVPKAKIVDVLFEAVAAGHRFEASGPLREVWNGDVTSISLPPERIVALLDAVKPQRRSDLQSEANKERDPASISDSSATSIKEKGLKSGYQWLKDTLHYQKEKPKSFPKLYPGEAPSGKRRESKTEPAKSQNESDIRKETIRRLEEELRRRPEDGSLLRSLICYAADRLKHGTPWKKRITQRTVYNYVRGAGTPLLAHHDGRRLQEMEAEDFYDLYDNCIQGSRHVMPAKQASQLAYFHGYLVTDLGVPGVAVGTSTRGGRCFPDVGYVTPLEFAHALQLIDEHMASAESGWGSLVELKAAHAGMTLGFVTGARTSEVLLRENTELISDSNQRALLIRRNRYTRVKTFRSRRRVSIEGIVTDSDWLRLHSWNMDNVVLRPKGSRSHVALFPNWATGRPIEVERMTRWIGAALRLSTGQPKARPYWWRHTLTSNEFVSLLADKAMLNALRARPSDCSRIGLGRPGESLGYPAESVPLSQAHGANFRARRGHWRLRTSVETYIHLIALIQTAPSIQITANLTVEQLGQIAGLSATTARKRLNRTGASASNREQVIQCFFGAPSDAPTPPPDEIVSSNPAVTPAESSLETLISATIVAIRKGDLSLIGRSLHLTHAKADRWERALGAAASTNLYGVVLPGKPGQPHVADAIGIVKRTAKRELNVHRIDDRWLIECVKQAREDPLLLEAWRLVLRGMDLNTGYIAVTSKVDLSVLAIRLGRAAFKAGSTAPDFTKKTPKKSAPKKDLSETEGSEKDASERKNRPRIRIELIRRATDSIDERQLQLKDGTRLVEFPILASKRFRPLHGCLNLGLRVKDEERDHALISTLFLTALLASATTEHEADLLRRVEN